MRGREGGALGGAVAVAEREGRQRGLCAAHVRHRERFAAGEQVAQAGQVGRVVVDHGIEERRREPGGVHVVARDGARQAGTGGHALLVDHAAAAVEQRAPDLERGGVETQRCGMQHGAARGEHDVVHADHQPQDGAVADLDALGRAGGARGVHDVGHRLAVDGREIPRTAFCLVGIFVEQQNGVFAPLRRHEVVVRLRGQHVVRARLFQHVGDALGREIGRYRHIGGARFQNAEQRDDGCHRTVEQQAHGVAAAHAQALQAVGELVGAGVQFGVAHPHVAFREGDGVRRGLGLQAEHAGDRERAVQRRDGGVPRGQLVGAVGARQGADVAEGGVGARLQVGGGVGQGCEQGGECVGVHQAGRGIDVKAGPFGVEAQTQHRIGTCICSADVFAQPERVGLVGSRGRIGGGAACRVQLAQPVAGCARGVVGDGDRPTVRAAGLVQHGPEASEPTRLQQQPGAGEEGVGQQGSGGGGVERQRGGVARVRRIGCACMDARHEQLAQKQVGCCTVRRRNSLNFHVITRGRNTMELIKCANTSPTQLAF